MTKKKEEILRQNIFTKRSCERLAMIEAFYEIALALAHKMNAFYHGDEIAKPCLQILARSLGDKSTKMKANEIALSEQTVTRCTEVYDK